MSRKLKLKAVIVLLAICVSIYFVAAKGLKKGLDIAGGSHFTIGVDLKDVSDSERIDAMERTLAVYRNRIDEIGVAGTTIQRSGNDQIIVQIPGINTKESERIKKILNRQAHLEFKIVIDTPINTNT